MTDTNILAKLFIISISCFLFHVRHLEYQWYHHNHDATPYELPTNKESLV